MLRSAEQSTLERKRAIAVSARSFRKKNQRVAGGQSSRYRLALSYRAPHSPIDENRALQLGQPTDKRPVRHFLLGDKGSRNQRAENRDVSIRYVICRKQYRAIGDRLADDADPKSKNATAPPMIKGR